MDNAQEIPPPPENQIAVDFTKKHRPSQKAIGEGVYEDPRNGAFYWRPYVDGRQTWAKLQSTTPRYAKIEAGKLRAELAMSKRGMAESPFARAKTVAELCEFYLAQGCPRKKIHAQRQGKELDYEKTRVEKLKAWPGSQRHASAITLEDCREYHAWRIKTIKTSSTGDRQVDKELITLSNVFRCAMRNTSKTGIRSNPIAIERQQFRDPDKIKHCRDYAPANAEELHALARMLFAHPASEVLGWQMLLEAMIGQRSHEIIKLRWDAPDKNHAGYIQGKHLFLHRSLSSKGTFPFTEITPALKACLAALSAWRQQRYPNTPWYLPSPQNPSQAVNSTSLTHALARITPGMNLPQRTSHGMRAYYVNVMRSQGYSDAEVSLRIGQKSGGKLIITTYGEILPYKLSWLPKKENPAWIKWTPAKTPIQEQDQLPI